MKRTIEPTSISRQQLDLEKTFLLIQASYYIATGVWPLLSMRSFERVTGAKTDKWLVKTVGVLVTAIGATLLLATQQKRVSVEARLLANGSGAALALIDLVYVLKGRISRVYVLDAVAEVALLTSVALGRKQ